MICAAITYSEYPSLFRSPGSVCTRNACSSDPPPVTVRPCATVVTSCWLAGSQAAGAGSGPCHHARCDGCDDRSPPDGGRGRRGTARQSPAQHAGGARSNGLSQSPCSPLPLPASSPSTSPASSRTTAWATGECSSAPLDEGFVTEGYRQIAYPLSMWFSNIAADVFGWDRIFGVALSQRCPPCGGDRGDGVGDAVVEPPDRRPRDVGDVRRARRLPAP